MLNEVIKSLREPLVEGRGIKVFRLNESSKEKCPECKKGTLHQVGKFKHKRCDKCRAVVPLKESENKYQVACQKTGKRYVFNTSKNYNVGDIVTMDGRRRKVVKVLKEADYRTVNPKYRKRLGQAHKELSKEERKAFLKKMGKKWKKAKRSTMTEDSHAEFKQILDDYESGRIDRKMAERRMRSATRGRPDADSWMWSIVSIDDNREWQRRVRDSHTSDQYGGIGENYTYSKPLKSSKGAAYDSQHDDVLDQLPDVTPYINKYGPHFYVDKDCGCKDGDEVKFALKRPDGDVQLYVGKVSDEGDYFVLGDVMEM